MGHPCSHEKLFKLSGLRYSYETLCFLSLCGARAGEGTMNRIGSGGRGSIPRLYSFLLIFAVLLALVSCTKPAVQPKPAPSRPSDIKVEVRDGGPVVLTTSAAEFQILPSGFLQATLLKDGKRLTLDEPGVGSAGGSDSIVHEGKELEFVPDFATAKVLEGGGKAGARETGGDSGASAGAGGNGASSARWWSRRTTIFRTSRWSARHTRMWELRIFRWIRCGCSSTVSIQTR